MNWCQVAFCVFLKNCFSRFYLYKANSQQQSSLGTSQCRACKSSDSLWARTWWQWERKKNPFQQEETVNRTRCNKGSYLLWMTRPRGKRVKKNKSTYRDNKQCNIEHSACWRGSKLNWKSRVSDTSNAQIDIVSKRGEKKQYKLQRHETQANDCSGIQINTEWRDLHRGGSFRSLKMAYQKPNFLGDLLYLCSLVCSVTLLETERLKCLGQFIILESVWCEW